MGVNNFPLPSATGCRTILAGAMACLTLVGCAVGPDFKQPPPPASARFAADATVSGGADQQRLISSATLPEHWWTLFGSAQLDALVDQALAGNSGLEVATATLRQTRAQLGIAQAELLPSVDLAYAGERAKTASILSPTLNNNDMLYSLHTAQVAVNYSLDLFGGARRNAESARAQEEAAEFQYEAARLSIATNTVLAAIQAASLQEQMDAAEDNVASARQILRLFEKRQAIGDVGAADVAAQRAALAQAEQALPPLRQALDAQHATLSVLLGREPGAALPPLPKLAELTLPRDLPLSLPSDLVRQRPDIRAAEANLHAASANVGVAITARLPDISLQANIGGTATRLADLFTGDAAFWSIGGGIVQPLFHGGALLNQQRAAEAALDIAKAQYRSTVLTAFQDVTNTLSALRNDADALQSAQQAETAAEQAMKFTQRKLELGSAGTLDTLNARITLQTARAAAIQFSAARYADTVALFQALGGGWWNRGSGRPSNE
ncbi:MAG: efflux transporter outer membrane subunit [Gallionellaceae bacterium]|nr:efflux transporter outer membrane subunit [Gallionellaceae bacterium]